MERALDRGAAAHLAALCLADRGRLSTSIPGDVAVRAGLLLDMAVTGRLVQGVSTIDVDDAPTGYAPVDQLSADMAAHPAHDLTWWLFRGRVDARSVAAELCRAGVWRRRVTLGLRPRFEPTDPAWSRPAVEGRLSDAADPDLRDCAAIARAAGLLPSSQRPAGVPAPGQGSGTAWVAEVALGALADYRSWRLWGTVLN